MKRPYQITDTEMPDRQVWSNEFCMWVSVPKNANMRFRAICNSIGMMKKQDDFEYPPERFFIIRNPYTRVLSGLGEFKSRNKRPEEFEELLFEFKKDPKMFDEHLEPQVSFVYDIDYTNILKFEDLNNQIRTIKYLRKNYIFNEKKNNPYLKINRDRLSRSRHYKKPLEEIEKIYKNDLDEIINKYYGYDLEIWKNPNKYIGKKI